MKSTLLCLIGMSLLCLVAVDAMTELAALKDVYLKCTNMTGVSKDMIVLVNKGEWPEENDILKEWVHCVLVESKLMTEEGKLQIDDAFKDLSKTEADIKYQNINKCVPTHTYNIPAEEISWHFAKCLQTEDPKNSFF